MLVANTALSGNSNAWAFDGNILADASDKALDVLLGGGSSLVWSFILHNPGIMLVLAVSAVLLAPRLIDVRRMS